MAHAVRYQADLDPPFCSLNVKGSFDQLSSEEKLYAHWVGVASWAGARIIQGQWTSEAQSLYDLLIRIFTNTDGTCVDFSRLKEDSRATDEHWKHAISYTAQVFGNLVNYKSFGFSKFIPQIRAEDFRAIVSACPNREVALEMWDKLVDYIYNVQPEASLLIGDPNKGHTTNYYFGQSPTTEKEVLAIQKAAEKEKIDVLNTRVENTGKGTFTLHVASVDESERDVELMIEGSEHPGTLKIKYGDFKEALQKSIDALNKAKDHTTNTNQKGAIENYIKSFQTGDIGVHKEGSRHWVKDVGPVVESYIGFIETYVDPFGARAEWEGFTAIVNKMLSAKYETLVNKASELIKALPWGPDFEVDQFRRPDFTALEVVSFATGGIPAGINIPSSDPDSYYEIREKVGFKNVSLANILSAKAPNEEITFIAQEDLEIYNKWDSKAFELQVANHELLGHGSGKLFTEDEHGNFNFDRDTVINPLTQEKIKSWYKPGQTPGSVLGAVSSSMEECRAEAVALYLVSNREILSIFGYEDQRDIDDIQYVTFLLMCRAGVRALEFYDPKAKKHLQAHMQARMGITNHLIDNRIAEVVTTTDDNGTITDAYIKVDRQAVLTKGKSVMGELLIQLQVRKSTADADGAKKFYEDLTRPKADWIGELRELVLFKKQPRKLFVQPNTLIEDEGVVMKEYELSAQGMIESYIDRKLCDFQTNA